jgi:iron complex transport system ATP-binding protein
MSLLQTVSLSVSIGGKVICRDLDFTLEQGQHWGILGGNGVGKTTLLQTLAGLLPADSGDILIAGRKLQDLKRRELARKLGVLFQDSHDTFPGSVMETALIGRHPWLPFWSFEGEEDIAMARAALQDVAMESMAHRQVNTLSGGERRRLAIASLLVQNPLLWLLDEPTNHLDLKHQIKLLDLLLHKADTGNGGLIMVLHDVNLITRFCTHVMLMLDHENIISGAVEKVVTLENLQQLYQYPIKQVTAGRDKRFFYPG